MGLANQSHFFYLFSGCRNFRRRMNVRCHGFRMNDLRRGGDLRGGYTVR